MKIGSISENREIEQRVAITPDIIKKYKSLGLEVNLSKDYASHLGISDKEYESAGANILKTEEDTILNTDAILQMTIPNDKYLNKFKKDQTLIGVLNPYQNENKPRVVEVRRSNDQYSSQRSYRCREQ